MNSNNNNTAAINLNETSVHVEAAAAIVAVLEAGNVAAIAATCNNLDEALACKAEGNKVVFKHVHFNLTVEAGGMNLKGFTEPAEIAEYLKRAILNY